MNEVNTHVNKSVEETKSPVADHANKEDNKKHTEHKEEKKEIALHTHVM